MTVLSRKPVLLKDAAYIVTEFTNGNFVFRSDHKTMWLTTVIECSCPGYEYSKETPKRCRHTDYTRDWRN